MKRVVLDPGHGGPDPGAVGLVIEKTITLPIACHARDRLRCYQGVEVEMTRVGDTYVSLPERCRIANEAGADAFISFHDNCCNAEGFESFVVPGATNAALLQQCIHAALGLWLFDEHQVVARSLQVPEEILARLDEVECEAKDRGQKMAGFYVLKHTVMPAVLLECLFVDCEQDATLLKNPGFQQRLGYSIADGVARYLGVAPVKPYVCSKQYEAVIEWARTVGLSAAQDGHDYTLSISEERFLAIIQRLPNLMEALPKWKAEQ